MTDAPPRTGRSAKVVAAAVIVGLIGSGALVWQASSAAFTATTDNTGNSWQSGKVVLSDNDSGTALFNASNLVPGATGNNCIEVEYDGDVASTVKLYSNVPTGTLGQYLELDVELGSGVSCAVPGVWTQIYGDANATLSAGDDTLAEFAVAHTNFSDGIAGWTPNSINTVRPYRITWTLVDTNSAQNLSASAVNFTWEAQNT